MSEYASSKHSKDEASLEATVFDDALLDEMTKNSGSSENEVRRQLGIEAAPKIEAEPGAFVTLDARAIAVHGILDGINLRNKASGATQQTENLDSEFRGRYKDPEEVASIMRFSAKQRTEQHLDTLNATEAMTRQGFDPDHVTFYKNRLVDRARAFEGTGRENVARRKKEAEKVQQTAIRSKSL
jgi:hypothetical protein